MLTVTVPSDALPEVGVTDTQESELRTDQSRLAVKVIVLLLPSMPSSILDGLVIVSSGAFWQAASKHKVLRKIKNRLIIIKEFSHIGVLKLELGYASLLK